MFNLKDEQTSLKALVTNTQDNFSRVNSEENLRLGYLNLYRWTKSNNKPKDSQYLTEEQAGHVYEKDRIRW